MKKWLVVAVVLVGGLYALYPSFFKSNLEKLKSGSVGDLAGEAIDTLTGEGQGSGDATILPADTTAEGLAMIAASERGDEAAVRGAIDAGVPLDSRATNGVTALIAAVSAGHDDLIDLLLRAGAQPDARMTNGRTSLMIACADGKDAVVRRLLAAGANPNLQSKAGNFALMEAAKSGSDRAARALLDAGADPDMTAENGWTAWDMAKQRGHSDVVRLREQGRP